MKPARLALTALAASIAAAAFAAKPAPTPLPMPLDPLPLEAQVLVDKGVDTAKGGDYAKALALFEDAGRKAPESAVIFRNRGLAESKIPGREFRAVAWFGAYLDAVPDAPDAAAVRQALKDARRQADATWVVLAKGFVDAAGSGWHREKAQGYLSRALIASGDLKGAEAALNEIKSDYAAASFRLELAVAKAKAGDLAGARAMVAKIASVKDQGNYQEIMGAMAEISAIQAKAGDKAGLAESLAMAKSIPPRYDQSSQRSEADAKVARLLFAAGDKDGAAASVRDALVYAQKDDSLKLWHIEEGGELQAELGDLDGARATADALKGEDYYRSTLLIAIARQQVKRGDTAGAMATVAQTADFMRATALANVGGAQVDMGQTAAGLATLTDALKLSQSMKSALDRTMIQAKVAFYQAHAGAYDAARATLDIAGKSQKKIPPNPAGGLFGPNSNQRQGYDALVSSYSEIRWLSRPWTKWTHHLSNVLESSPFPNVVEKVKKTATDTSDPEVYLGVISGTLDEIAREEPRLDKLIAGGMPY